MHRFTAILLLLSFCSLLFAQPKEDNSNKNAADNAKKNESTMSKIPEGYGDITWGTYLSDAKEKIKGRLTYTDDKKIIISNDGELQYHYGFFYKDPSMTSDKILGDDPKKTDPNKTNDTEKKDEGKFFYVSMKFPYLNRDSVYEKIKARYGIHSTENIKNNQGAYAWDSEKTVVIMWVDNYEKKAFCRRVIFVSKEISKDLNKYSTDMFFKKELELIKKVNP